jgi:gamma-glutamyltranspeptidase / glutathione hydrolase
MRSFFSSLAPYAAFSILFALSQITQAQKPPHGAVASAHPMATQAGIDLLKQGGNAFDASIAIASTLAVVEPHGSGLGGGGFWLMYQAKSKKYIFIDARETAPVQLTEKMLLDEKGLPKTENILNGALGAGIPGEIAAFDYIAKNLATQTPEKQLQHAIEAAKKGFPVTESLQKMISFRLNTLKKNKESSQLFLVDQAVPNIGYIIKQPALADTLTALSKNGFHSFYQKESAEKLVSALANTGSVWSVEDLTGYQVKLRPALIGHYKGYTFYTAPLPSAGGIALINAFHILNHFNLTEQTSENRTHLLVEAFRRSYKDRLNFGDPDFIQMPMNRFIQDNHASTWAKTISLEKATQSITLTQSIHSPPPAIIEKEHTTHFSVIDQEGNMVSATLSLNLPFGSGMQIPQTGIFLNNQLDDFSVGTSANSYGLVDHPHNHPAPKKRPLSSMTPTIIEGHQQISILGTPGGSRIPTMVILSSLSLMEGLSAKEAAALPRFHHQWMPDHIEFEASAISENHQQILTQKGHSLKKLNRNYGNMQIIRWNKKTNIMEAASDPRGDGSALRTID